MENMEDLFAISRLFINREVLTDKYIPDNLPGRDEQIRDIAYHLSPALQKQPPGHLMVYGMPGSGKTITLKYVIKLLNKKAEKENIDYIHTVYVNCGEMPNQSQILQFIIDTFSDVDKKLMGWGIDKYYHELKSVFSKIGGEFIIVLDEIDKIKNDMLLYNLTRLEVDSANVSLIGISNDLKFFERLDPRIRSSLGRNSIIFPPYSAPQLIEILKQRVQLGIKEDAISEEVIPLCAAIAAQREGDARKAIDLLRTAVELAEREGSNKVTEKHVRKAETSLEMDGMISAVSTFPTHQKLLLLAIILNEEAGIENVTGKVYSTYIKLCQMVGISPSTIKWVWDTISQYDMLGILNARVISRGRYGRSTKVTLAAPLNETKEVLLRNSRLSEEYYNEVLSILETQVKRCQHKKRT